MTNDTIAFWVTAGLSLPVLAFLARKHGLGGMVDDTPSLATLIVGAGAVVAGCLAAILTLVPIAMMIALAALVGMLYATYFYLRK